MTTHNRRLAPALVGLVLISCTASPPPTSTPTQGPSEPASASASPSPSGEGSGGRDSPPACLDAKLVYADSLGQLLLANCFDQSDASSTEELWAWDGDVWERLGAEGPPANVVTGIGWDGDRDVFVRYGGIPLADQECSTETWEWDTVEWRLIEAEPPEPCDHHELAWEASAGRMVLFGGGRGRELVSGTWAWDGTAWSQLTDEGPVSRAHHGFVFDEPGARAFLYGGYDGRAVFDDLWAWDGSAWEQFFIEGNGPGPRSHHGLVATPAGLLLFGGATTSSTFTSLVDDTWLFSGDRWSRIDTPGPSARGMPALGYDPDRDVVVLYGGFEPDGTPLADTWEWDGSAWRCVAAC